MPEKLADVYHIEDQKDGEWVPIYRISRTVPFGYKEDPDNKKILLPIKKELDALQQAMVFLRDYSMRDVSLWLEKETGRKISHEGLRKRVKSEKLRRKKLASTYFYARLYKEAIEEAKKLEGRVGTNRPNYTEYSDSEGTSAAFAPEG